MESVISGVITGTIIGLLYHVINWWFDRKLKEPEPEEPEPVNESEPSTILGKWRFRYFCPECNADIPFWYSRHCEKCGAREPNKPLSACKWEEEIYREVTAAGRTFKEVKEQKRSNEAD